MRLIYWGVISFFIGLVGYLESTNLYGVIIHPIPLGSSPPLEWQLIRLLVVVFGLVFLSSLPIAVIAEVVRRQRSKRVSYHQTDITSRTDQ
ncbi:MAG TPA: hypothetical protein VK127_00055 [Nitrososphaerales archaeon]|nr:hypothetical protein [Nitrososphaerales archaeon]